MSGNAAVDSNVGLDAYYQPLGFLSHQLPWLFLATCHLPPKLTSTLLSKLKPAKARTLTSSGTFRGQKEAVATSS